MHEILFAAGVVRDLKRIRARERRMIMDVIRDRLAHEPTRPTRHRKQLRKLVPPWEAVPPIWQLRVGEYRVFYDVDEDAKKLFVRAVRLKLPRATTEEVL